MSLIKVTLQERKSKKKSRAVTIHSNIYVRCELWGRGSSQFLLEGCGTASFPKRSLLTTIFHRKKKKKERHNNRTASDWCVTLSKQTPRLCKMDRYISERCRLLEESLSLQQQQLQ